MFSAGDFLDKRSVISSIKLLVFSIIMILCAVLLNECGKTLSEKTDSQATVTAFDKGTVVIIDAGHGGEDGGAVGINGCIEKDINLEIALTLYELLRACDVPAVLTRSEDVMLYDNSLPGKKKSQDLKKRLEISQSYRDTVLVSIHMNSYPSEKYKGLQVYYSGNDPESKVLADLIQSKTQLLLQPENKRQTKKATSAIYLLHNAKVPAVLAECGFISNQSEARLLCTKEYQNKIAVIIYTSLIEYISNQRI